MMTSRDMSEIRKDIYNKDIEYGLAMEVVNPNTGISKIHSMIEFNEFFFPSY